MKFSEIEIHDFRQYYKTSKIDLTTNVGQNIILIGGKNGYGKTNLLLSIVWCLYGEKMSDIDDNFKREINIAGNYPRFLRDSLNWTAKRENKDLFSVSLVISDIESYHSNNTKSNSIRITRTFNSKTTDEKLSIIDLETNKEIYLYKEDKVNFINDHIIPLDAAKFVFFDAEKISEIADFNIRDEGNFINDALNKILGLDVYDTLVNDLDKYINDLSREGADEKVKEKIINFDSEIELSKLEIDDLEQRNDKKLKQIEELKGEIEKYDDLISKQSVQKNLNIDRDSLLTEIKQLKNKRDELTEQFKEISETIPLAILTSKLQEVNEHLEIQSQNELSENSSEEISEKIDDFIDKLFNQPPEPKDSNMSFRDKTFYYEKAKALGIELFSINEENEGLQLEFEHDLNKSEKELFTQAITHLNSHSSNIFETIFDELNEVQLRVDKQEKTLHEIDADLQDELIVEYKTKKEIANNTIDNNNRIIGENNQKTQKIKRDLERLDRRRASLVQKVGINTENSAKIKEAQRYIDVLKTFIEKQKLEHRDNLEKTILDELLKLMHKLDGTGNDNTDRFIKDVEVTILGRGQGMRVALKDQYNQDIRKESLSSGEKQIYISCLIKGIMSQSTQNLPIFIDTPLGRLDDEHRDNITREYYRTLSEQVVLFSTDSEITSERYIDISNYVSKSYLLVNDGNNTTVRKGYFNTIHND